MKTSNKILVALMLAVFVALSVLVAIIYIPDKAEAGQDVYVESNAEAEKDNKTEEDKTAVKKEPDENFTAIACKPTVRLSQAVESEKPETKSVSFAAVGDMIVHSTVLADARDNASGTDKEYVFSTMFDKVADVIEQADFAYINQEAPIAGKSRGYSGYPLFNAPEQVVLDLKEAGFNIFNIANNHMLDKHTSI